VKPNNSAQSTNNGTIAITGLKLHNASWDFSESTLRPVSMLLTTSDAASIRTQPIVAEMPEVVVRLSNRREERKRNRSSENQLYQCPVLSASVDRKCERVVGVFEIATADCAETCKERGVFLSFSAAS
jgi:hypothetical protein